jgi:hypothetical protein
MTSNNTKSHFSFNRYCRHCLLYIGKFLIRVAKWIWRLWNWIIKHILALAAIASALAAIFTIYLTTLQSHDIKIQAGGFIAISPCTCSNIGYILQIPVSFYNGGAQPGIIERVGLAIKDPSNNMFSFFFKSNYDTTLKEENGIKIWQTNSAYSSIIVPPRNVVSRTLVFETSEEVDFSPNKNYEF